MIIPQVSNSSDYYYWTEIFPKRFKHRQLTKLTWMCDDEDPITLTADGDVHFDEVNGKHFPTCLRCSKSHMKLHPRLFGSLDVGMQVVYKCSECNEIIATFYHSEEDIQKYAKTQKGVKYEAG